LELKSKITYCRFVNVFIEMQFIMKLIIKEVGVYKIVKKN
jgi:hypothetical protein